MGNGAGVVDNSQGNGRTRLQRQFPELFQVEAGDGVLLAIGNHGPGWPGAQLREAKCLMEVVRAVTVSSSPYD